MLYYITLHHHIGSEQWAIYEDDARHITRKRQVNMRRHRVEEKDEEVQEEEEEDEEEANIPLLLFKSRKHKLQSIQTVTSARLASICFKCWGTWYQTHVETSISHQLNAQLLYSLITSVTLYSSTCFEHRCAHLQESALNQCTVWQLTQCDNTRYCRHTISFPPEDEHIDARNMLRNIV